MPNLFREEAVANRAASVFGNIAVGSGPAATIFSLTSIGLAACLAALLALGSYARKEHAVGYLVPSAGLIEVESPRVGLITHVSVREGESVRAGAPLFTVALPKHALSGLELDNSRIAHLVQERDIIAAQIARRERLSRIQARDDQVRIRALRHELASSEAQRRDALERLNILSHNVDRLKSLQKQGNVAPSLLDKRTAALLQVRRDVHGLDGNIDQLTSQISSLEAETQQIPLRLDIRRGDLHSRELEVERSLDEAKVDRSTVVHAPVAGRVTTIIARPGMNVNRQHRLMAIIPKDSSLQAELLVPTRAIGFIRKGQMVELRYDAFPYQKFGLYRGRVTSISSTVLSPQDQMGPVRLSAPAYRVIAVLESQKINAYGRRIALQPGLTLKADIVRDRRRIIEWVFDPLLAAVRGI